MREEIHYFIPLYINPTHGKSIHTIMYPGVFSLMTRDIQQCFEKSLVTITGGKQFDHSLILNVLPKLMNSAVVSFMNGTTHTSERALRGYFAFHRLFLWACEQYKLVPKINTKLEDFIKNPGARSKANTPNIGDWLTYLSVSPNFGWEHASIAYLKENMLRNVMWYLKEQPNLAKTDDAAVNARRFEDTFRLTKVSRDLLAFQVLFLDIAKPKDLSLQQVFFFSPPITIPPPSSITSVFFSIFFSSWHQCLQIFYRWQSGMMPTMASLQTKWRAK